MARLRIQLILLGLMLTICCSQDVEYILPVLDIHESVVAVAGETGGWCEVQSISGVNVKAHAFSSFNVYGFSMGGIGIGNNKVLVKANNVQIYYDMVLSPFPISALGTKYIVSFCILPSVYNYSSSIVITTHSYKTDVDITFRLEGNVIYDNRTYTDGDTLTVSLQEYQTLTIISDWDLSGTVITATQTVAVFSVMYSYDRSNQPRASTQLLPVHLYGQEYVVAVDDNPSLYQIQIVSEASNTTITFNNGSTITMDESRIFKQNITSNNTVLYFSSSRPVMTILCRLDMYGTAAWMRDNFLAIRPVSLYTKETSVVTNNQVHTLKILTDKAASDTTMKINSIESPLLEWEEIPGSRYKVGTAVTTNRRSIVSITSNTNFTVLLFTSNSMYTGGYNFSQPTRPIDVEYILPLLKGFGEVSAVAGETGGWCEVQAISEMNVKPYESSSLYPFRNAKKGTHIENNNILVKANNVQIYSDMSFNVYFPIPISALGTKYIVSFCIQPTVPNYSSSIVITTHSYKTGVDITFRLEGNLTYDNRTFTDGDTLTVSLQEYQTLTINSDWDLTGTVVRSTQTVAVFSVMNSYDRSNLPTAASQLLPVHLYGQEYVVAVDDNLSLYHLQMVSEGSDTRITFNDGSTVTMDETGIFKQNITSNTTLYFSSSRPVMTILCRVDTDGEASPGTDNFVVLPPVCLYSKQTSVLFFGHSYTLKILTDNQASDIAVKMNSTEIIQIEWKEIPGSRYKVGTAVTPYNWGTASITSSTSFAVLVFNRYNMYTGGYNFSQPTSQIGMFSCLDPSIWKTN